MYKVIDFIPKFENSRPVFGNLGFHTKSICLAILAETELRGSINQNHIRIMAHHLPLKKLFLTTLTMLALANVFAQPDLELSNFATGFVNPVDIANAGDERLFIVEQAGLVWVLDADGNKFPEPFLDIDDRVGSGGERGLLGIAFHPDYVNSGYFYVNYTNNSGDTRISRFSVTDTDPNLADPDSEVILMTIAQPFGNHNGGCIKFGPDGYLYTSLGDGGSGGDPQNNSQNRQTFLGKMLRIDVDNGSPYSIPDSNPFSTDDETLDEIWALGLRNAWRFSFDRVTGDLWMGDVGQNAWDEIDFQPASSPGGENYGWRCYEGNATFNTSGCNDASTMTFPILEHDISFNPNCSVTGGFVYRGCEFPGLWGHYIFSDYCSDKFWSIAPDGQGGWVSNQLSVSFGTNNVPTFGENSDGELFVSGHNNGIISKITSPSSMLVATGETCEGDNDGSISFTVPTDQFTSITWTPDIFGPAPVNLAPGMYSVEVTTSNGCNLTQTIEVEAGEPYPDQPIVNVGQDGLLTTGAVANSYQWFFNSQPIQDATGNSYLATENGLYSLVVANANGCETASSEVNVVITSTVFQELGFEMASLTPNPFESTFQLRLETPQLMDFEIKITDISGKHFRKESHSANGYFEKTYNLQDLPSGIYFFTMKNEKGEWTEQVVKK